MRIHFFVIIWSHRPYSSESVKVRPTASQLPLPCHARVLRPLHTPLARQHNTGLDHEVGLTLGVPWEHYFTFQYFSVLFLYYFVLFSTTCNYRTQVITVYYWLLQVSTCYCRYYRLLHVTTCQHILLGNYRLLHITKGYYMFLYKLLQITSGQGLFINDVMHRRVFRGFNKK